MKDFKAGIAFFNRVAELAEAEGHHPDLHLEDYRNVWIELWTHSIGGLSENDFILAAKIDQLKMRAVVVVVSGSATITSPALPRDVPSKSPADRRV